MKISELAKHAKCSTETIRFYEKQGLLPAAMRADNNYRYYAQHHVDRLKLIRNCRALDMNLDEVRALLHLIDHPKQTCESVSSLLQEHITHIRIRIAQLTQLEQDLLHVVNQCANQETSNNCVIVNTLMSMETSEDPDKKHTHLG